MAGVTMTLTRDQLREIKRGFVVVTFTPDQIKTVGAKISSAARKVFRGGRPQKCFCAQCPNCRRRIKRKEKREADRLAALSGKNQAEWMLPAGQEMPECKPVASIGMIRKF